MVSAGVGAGGVVEVAPGAGLGYGVGLGGELGWRHGGTAKAVTPVGSFGYKCDEDSVEVSLFGTVKIPKFWK